MSARKDGWAIYATFAQGGDCVLLNDGAWTNPENCRGAVAERDTRDFGAPRHRPMLFRTKAQAARHLRQCCRPTYYARIVEWSFEVQS